MTTPTTTNTDATDVNSAISKVGNDLVSVAEAAIIADVPWLGWFGISWLWEAIFQWVAGYFERAAETGATFAVIDLQVGSEVSAVTQARAALLAAEKSGDANAIKQAIQNYSNAYSSVVHDDGSAPH